ncbi:MAG: hypothetical protein JSW54_07065 [Fidelibacterota bacterium]|nr:MAG: hypothetical protein JSW54_07065 [Candidatus Neomarinimicrobiota bacterium]
MKKTISATVVALILCGSLVRGQEVRLDGGFRDFVTFYVSSVDVTTGASDVELFDYALVSTSYPVEVWVEFRVLINSAPLNLDYSTPFLEITTQPFTLSDHGAVHIRNTDLDVNTDHLLYDDGTRLNISVNDPATIFDDPDFDPDQMKSLIIQSGRLPDGTYRFEVTVHNLTNPAGSYTKEETVISAYPISLGLISPGGPLEDTTNTAITTTYPFFQWESDPCAICGYRIRVAEFVPGEHSTMDDAIEDQTVLPLDQAAGYFPPPNEEPLATTSFQYPQSGAIDLEPGHIYVWQVQKSIPTTEGDETINSFIWAFQIIDPTSAAGTTTGAGLVVQGPILRLLQNAMGADSFDEVFGVGGDLEGFRPTQGIRLNGESIDPSQVNAINDALQQGTVTIISVEVQ